ncbi:MAG: hypothetical protein AAFP16_05815 [Pseudomonadota bacterium]
MKPGQSTFDERVTRINKGRTITPVEVQPEHHQRRALARNGRGARKLYLNFMVIGSVVGGLMGLAFASRVGLPAALAMDGAALYALAEDDVLTLLYMGVAALGPAAWLLSQFVARNSPKARRFWFGYMCGVFASNSKDLQPHVDTFAAQYGPIIAPYTDPVLAMVAPHFETAQAAIAPHVQTVMSMFG